LTSSQHKKERGKGNGTVHFNREEEREQEIREESSE
jgi:hypothetical protein